MDAIQQERARRRRDADREKVLRTGEMDYFGIRRWFERAQDGDTAGTLQRFLSAFPLYSPRHHLPTFHMVIGWFLRGKYWRIVKALVERDPRLLTIATGSAILSLCAASAKLHRSKLVHWLLSRMQSYPRSVVIMSECGYMCAPLHEAASHWNAASIALLLDCGGDPYCTAPWPFRGDRQRTPLQLASLKTGAAKGRPRAIALLQEATRSGHWPLLEWRPHVARHRQFPAFFRAGIQTILLLAKARRVKESTTRVRVECDEGIRITEMTLLEKEIKCPQACFALLPEELLQYIYLYVTAAPLWRMVAAHGLRETPKGKNE